VPRLTAKSIVVPVILLAGVGIVAYYLMSAGGLLHGYALLTTYTDDAGGLTVGSTVRLNGITIGYLDKLVLTNSRDRKRKVELELRVQPRVLAQIPADSTAGLAAISLVGDNYINIVKGRSARHVQPGDEVTSRLPEDMGQMMTQMQRILLQFNALAARADALLASVSSGQGTIGKWTKGKNEMTPLEAEITRLSDDFSNAKGTLPLLMSGALGQQMDATSARFQQVTAAIGSGPGTAAKMNALMSQANDAMKEVNGLLAQMQSPQGVSGRMDELSKRFEELSAKLNGIFDRIDSGEGTLGQFTVNPQFSEAMAATTREFNSLAADARRNPRKFLSFQFRLF